MGKMLLVASHEFWRHVKRRGYLFSILGLPLLGFALFVVLLILMFSISNQPIGLIDHSGQLLAPAEYSPSSPLNAPIYGYADEALALVDLEIGLLQAVVVVAADYVESGGVKIYHRGSYFAASGTELQLYLRTSLLRDNETAVRTQLNRPPTTRFVSLTETAETAPSFIAYVVPFAIGFIFILGIFTSGGYLIQAVVDEKENRTMEIMITSMTPQQLISGKIIGLTGVGLLQIIIWSGLLLLGTNLVLSQVSEAASLTITPLMGLIIVGWFIPFYLLISTLMVAVGLSVTNMGEAQQSVSIITMLTLLPTYLAMLVVGHPNSNMAVLFSLFPFSSPVTLLVRAQIVTVPPLQLIGSWLILMATNLLALVLVGRLLRYGTLRYSQRLTWRSLWAG